MVERWRDYLSAAARRFRTDIPELPEPVGRGRARIAEEPQAYITDSAVIDTTKQ